MRMGLNELDSEDPAKPKEAGASMMRAFLAHTKCPPSSVERFTPPATSGPAGFFEFAGLRLYGRVSAGSVSPTWSEDLPTIDSDVSVTSTSVTLPFNPTEIIDGLRLEKYVTAVNSQISYISGGTSRSRRLYYALRPLLPVAVRRILQRVVLQDWATIPFPTWPVDTTVEDLINRLWVLALKASGEECLPFIWYWPKGFDACAIMTHDVETAAGQELCYKILELEREHGIRSSFELVPEVRYKISDSVVNAIRDAGCEICIHGLNHDGRLFSSEQEFRTRARKINQYADKLGANGFRSPVMYRNPSWYDAFQFSYDMSVPNVAHLDPQRGGCCTVLPFFIGDIVELPLTTSQDYTIYNILGTNALELWRQQMDTIVEKHGLVSFLVHPDYTVGRERQAQYGELLGLIKRFSAQRKLWMALPGDVDRWWRQRDNMMLSRIGGKWTIRGDGSDRAVIAYARMENETVRFVRAC